MAQNNENVRLTLNFDTRAARRQASSFWKNFSQLGRASAVAAQSGSGQLGARQIGGGLGANIAGTVAAPLVGQLTAGLFGQASRLGTAAFAPQIAQLEGMTAENRVFERLRPIAEAQAIATGRVDIEGLQGIRKTFQEIEERREAGRRELGTAFGVETFDKLTDSLDKLNDTLRELWNQGTGPNSVLPAWPF